MSASPKGPVRPTARALGLFIVRESDEWNLEMFNAMREQTYAAHDDIDDVRAVRELGTLPMSSNTFKLKDGTEVFVHPLSRGNTRAYLFKVGDYWHFWSMASATKKDDDGNNEVTDLLIETFSLLRPVNVYVHNVSRLVRDRAQGARLQAALDEHVDVVWAGSTPFYFSGEMSAAGVMMFSMFAIVASMEREWIVQRLLAGKVAKWRRGEWMPGPNSVPVGYTLDPKTRQLVVDEGQRWIVEEVLKVLAFGVTPAQMQRDLDKAGLLTKNNHRRLGVKVPVGTMISPEGLVNSLYSFVSVWCHGEYLYRHVNAFKDLNALSGVVIARDPSKEKDPGELQLLCQVPLPAGGWAAPELLEAVVVAARRNSARLVKSGHTEMRPLTQEVENTSANSDLHQDLLTGDRMRATDLEARRRFSSRAKEHLAPFTGRGWRDGNYWYELRSAPYEGYTVVRWPLRDERVRDRAGFSNSQRDDAA
jgi:DNA invertase Pin-like site-specific DNA recombinase